MKYIAEKIEEMRLLREQGYSVPEISNRLAISKSTTLRYVKDVTILPEYIERWQNRRKSSKILLQRNLNLAEKTAKELLCNNKLRETAIIAAMLYWAEGSKKDFSLSNTDPSLISLFIKSLKNVFGLSSEHFKISIRIFDDLNPESCIKFWSETTGIVLGTDTTINVISGSKTGKLKYGMCRIRVRKSGLIHKTLFAIIKNIQSDQAPVAQWIERDTPNV